MDETGLPDSLSALASSHVSIHATASSVPSTPPWLGEVTLIVAYLCKQGILNKISERVRFARRRFGRYEVIDFLAVLFGYAISGERTLEAFYQRLQPFAIPFMALFERDQLPSRSALARFLAALTAEPVEALRTLFLDDVLSRPMVPERQTGGLMDRAGNAWVVFDLDGTRAGVVYELFFTNLPQRAFTAADVIELYLHRGAFEPTLADEDREQDPDRWCSHTAWGQECWQVVSQWVWNIRLELGHQLEPSPIRTTEFAPTVSVINEQPPTIGYGKPTVAVTFKAERFSGQDFTLQSDGTLRCPANQALVAHERRREADGSLRVVYGASIHSCRPCPLRERCQWNGGATAKPRQVSVLLHPVVVGSAPLLWQDWSRRDHRRACMHLLRHQRVEVQAEVGNGRDAAMLPVAFAPLSRAKRAHYRLTWAQRLARNARPETSGRVTIRLFGVPERFAASLGWTAA